MRRKLEEEGWNSRKWGQVLGEIVAWIGDDGA